MSERERESERGRACCDLLEASVQTREAELMAAEMELSTVDHRTKVESTLQEEAAIRQDNKEREMERLADAAQRIARVL